MIDILPDGRSAAANYRLLVGLVVPRPIAWVSTLNESGKVNLAPFSCYTFVSSDPPMVAINVGRRADGTPKDTARNARRTGELVVNVVSEDLVEPMHRSSAEQPPEVSEAELLGIALAPSVSVAPPRVAAAPAALECRLHDILSFGRANDLVVAEIVRFRIADGLSRDGKVDGAALRPLARLGGPHYARLGEILTLPSVGNPGPAERSGDR